MLTQHYAVSCQFHRAAGSVQFLLMHVFDVETESGTVFEMILDDIGVFPDIIH